MTSTRKPAGWVAAIAAIVLALGGAAYIGSQPISAQGPAVGQGRGDRGPGPMGRGMRGPGRPGGFDGVLAPLMLNRLNLTDAQRDQVKGILDSHRDEQRGLQQRAMAARQALEAAIQTSPLDEGAIRGKAADVAAVEADLAVARGRIISEVMQLLTSDQQAKLKELQAQQKQRGERRQDRRPNRGR